MLKVTADTADTNVLVSGPLFKNGKPSLTRLSGHLPCGHFSGISAVAGLLAGPPRGSTVLRWLNYRTIQF